MANTRFIDNIKFCPACATEYQSEAVNSTGAFKCMHCGLGNYVKPFLSVSAIIPSINAADEIILTERMRDPGKGKWDLPGGFVDYGENLEETIQRELNEELGVELSAKEIIHAGTTNYLMREVVYPVIVSYYVVDSLDIKSTKPDKNEVGNIESCKVSEIIEGKYQFNWASHLDAVKIYQHKYL